MVRYDLNRRAGLQVYFSGLCIQVPEKYTCRPALLFRSYLTMPPPLTNKERGAFFLHCYQRLGHPALSPTSVFRCSVGPALRTLHLVCLATASALSPRLWLGLHSWVLDHHCSSFHNHTLCSRAARWSPMGKPDPNCQTPSNPPVGLIPCGQRS